MATWMTHFRIADLIIKGNPDINPAEFITGSVAPDCGYGVKDEKDFIPPTTVTHRTPDGKKSNIDAEGFYNEYLSGKGEGYWFYMGYYVHLLTDILWSAEHYLPSRVRYKDEYEKNPDFLKVIKRDWNDLDHKFLRDNKDFESFKIFDSQGRICDYLPYYEKGQLDVQCRFIADFYKNFTEHDRLDREYYFMTEGEMDAFVKRTAIQLSEKIKRG